MKVLRAHHASLSCSDVARSRAFYGEVLGLSEIARPDFGFPGAWYQAGEIQLHLIQVPEGVDVGQAPARTNPLAHHVAFEIEDYETARDALLAHGIPAIETGAEVGQLFVQDPDGNVIELIRPGGRLGRRR
jgi:catechol 2,3-dioxygenase-like lactoylglutathione lyase family enzyme